MMEYAATPAGKPNTLKLINNAIIRKVFLRGKPLTCAQISLETEISVTTVRATVNEMLETGEISSLGLGESSGGRKSEQFIINNNCYNGVSLCVTYENVYASVINIAAEVLETQTIALDKSQKLEDTLLKILSGMMDERTRAIGIGVPGIVSPDGYMRKKSGEIIAHFNILPKIKRQITLPIRLENDLRASTLGFAKEVYYENSVAFIYIDTASREISAGFVEGDRILHGMGNFAGELGLMPYDGERDFREALFGAASERERMEIISTLVNWVCCVINPYHLMICGNQDFTINKHYIAEMVQERLPAKILPRIFVSADFIQYYIKGMAAITSEAIFFDQN